MIEAMLGVLGERLAPEGWRRRLIGRPPSGTFTRPVGNGVVQTLEVARAGVRVPDVWPVKLRVVPGVGHETVLGLWPLLGSRPDAAVLWDWSAGGANGTGIEFDGESDVPAFVDRVVALAEGPARAFAESFPDIDALIAAQRAKRPVDLDPEDAAHPEADGPSMADLVLVLAAGRLDEARAMLVDVEAEYADPGLDRRFARQVRRRLDSGTRDVPPVEDVLARLPGPAAPEGWSWSTTKRNVSARRAAEVAVRARASGKSSEELVEDLAAEYAARGLEVQRPSLAVVTEDILLSRRPLGRARSAVRQARILASGGKLVVDHIRNPGERDPEWLRPPDRAAYPVRDHAPTGHVAVVLDPGVEDLLGRVQQAALRRLPDGAVVDVWFTEERTADDDQPLVVVHIGAHRVGVVPTNRAAGFPAVFRAAALFDEDPVVTAMLARPGGRTWYLDLAAPALPQQPAPPSSSIETSSGESA